MPTHLWGIPSICIGKRVSFRTHCAGSLCLGRKPAQEHPPWLRVSQGSQGFKRNVVGALLQLLEAVDYLHSRWVMSRDLKLPNLLLTGDGRLKICDFGLARYFHAYEEPYTPRVVTLWYRWGSTALVMREATHALSYQLCMLPRKHALPCSSLLCESIINRHAACHMGLSRAIGLRQGMNEGCIC